jgi:hypothetical protein
MRLRAADVRSKQVYRLIKERLFGGHLHLRMPAFHRPAFSSPVGYIRQRRSGLFIPIANFQAHRVGIIDTLSRHFAIRILSNDMTIMWHELLECRPDVAPPENVLAFNIGLCSLKREKAILFDPAFSDRFGCFAPIVELPWKHCETGARLEQKGDRTEPRTERTTDDIEDAAELRMLRKRKSCYARNAMQILARKNARRAVPSASLSRRKSENMLPANTTTSSSLKEVPSSELIRERGVSQGLLACCSYFPSVCTLQDRTSQLIFRLFC